MADGSQSTAVAPRRVLLLADAVREEWTRSLEAGGLEVSTTGWHDAVTAARLRRPDVVLVSTDLPANAPQLLCNAFRAPDLGEIPIAVAGPGAERIEQETTPPYRFRADRYVAGPVDPMQIAIEVKELLRVGRVPLVAKPVQRLVFGLIGLSLFLPTLRLILDKFVLRWTGRGIDWVLFAAFAAPAVAALLIGLRARVKARPLSRAELRAALGWGGLLFGQSGAMLPGAGLQARSVAASLSFVALAAWAWLGPSPTPWFVRSRRVFRILAVILALLAVAPWAALPWLR